MFDIGWSELLVIGVVALIVIGPKELPTVLRTVGQWTGKIRRMAGEFQSQFQEALREAEMADLKKQVDDITDAARGLTSFNALDYDSNKWQSGTATPSAPAAGEAPVPPAVEASAAATETHAQEPAPSATPAEASAPPTGEASVPAPGTQAGEASVPIPEPALPANEKDFIQSPPPAPAQGNRPE